MRAPQERAKIFGNSDYFLPQKSGDVIIFKFQGGAMAPPCRMLATPLVGCVYAEALTFVKRDRTVSKFRAGNFGVGQATL